MSNKRVEYALKILDRYGDRNVFTDLPEDVDFDSMSEDDIYTYMESISNSFLYRSYGSFDLVNISSDKRYKLVDDYTITFTYHEGYEMPKFFFDELRKAFDKLRKALEILEEEGIPHAVYENNNPDGYILWISIFEEKK